MFVCLFNICFDNVKIFGTMTHIMTYLSSIMFQDFCSVSTIPVRQMKVNSPTPNLMVACNSLKLVHTIYNKLTFIDSNDLAHFLWFCAATR